MKKLALALFAGVLLSTMTAGADDHVASSAPAQKTYKLKEQIVIGRPAKPLAATEVSKLPMKSTLAELKQPFAGRVEQPVSSAPF